ncbi:hypothetical protein D9M73_224610 [compost metagenome]
MHGGFGDAVHVHQMRLAVAEAFEPRCQAVDVQRLAPEHHAAQCQWPLRLGRGGHRHQLLERRRGLVQHRDLFIGQQLVEGLG